MKLRDNCFVRLILISADVRIIIYMSGVDYVCQYWV